VREGLEDAQSPHFLWPADCGALQALLFSKLNENRIVRSARKIDSF
jgi:hypothetical protein